MASYYLRTEQTVPLEKEGEGIVVSPALYWYAHAKFPTKSLAKAKKLADAYLDSRPKNYETIHVEKREGGYDCYAYDAHQLRKRVEKLGTEDTPIWFLQQFVSQVPLRIDEHLVADTINGVVVEIPDETRALPSLSALDFSALAKPFNSPKNDKLPSWALYLLAGTLTVVMLLDLALRIETYQALRKGYESLETKRTTYEIKALLKRYEKEASAQESLRRSFAKRLSDKGLKRVECTLTKGCRGE